MSDRHFEWLPKRGTPLPLTAVWASLPLFAGFLLGLSRAIEPYDYWWALAMGRRIATEASIPDQNLFLYTMPIEAPFLNQPWLAQLSMYWVHDLGGPSLGIALLGLICAGFAVVVFQSLIRDGAEIRLAAVTTLVSLSLMAPIAAVRTRMYAILPAVLVASLLFALRRGNSKYVWWTIPLTVLWSNVHGSFVVAVAWSWLLCADLVFVKLWVDREQPLAKTPFAVALGITIAGMCNPLGFKTYLYVVQLALQSSVSRTVTEWQPPAWDEPSGALFLILLCIVGVLVAQNRKAFTLFEVSAFALTVYLGASSARSLLFPAIAFPLVLGPLLLMKTGVSETSKIEGRIHTAIIAICAVLVLATVPGGASMFDGLRGVTRRTEPGVGTLSTRNAGVEFRGESGRIFHDQAIGGQIEYALNAQSAFVDQRMELVPEEIWDEYEMISNAEPGWRALVNKYNIKTFVLSPDEQWFLCQALLAGTDAKLVTVDEHHVVIRLFDPLQDPTKKKAAERDE